MALTIGELVAKISAKDTGFGRALAKARAGLRSFKEDIDQSSRNVETLGKALASVGAIGSLTLVAGSAVQAAGALTVLPALGATVASTFATVKMATSGMGDALSAMADGDAEKAAEALDKLAPSARATVITLDAVRRSFGKVQQSVQQKMFAGISGEIKALYGDYLPILDQGLNATAVSLNGMAKEATATARTPFFKGVVAESLATTKIAMDNLTPAVGGLMEIIGALVRAGNPLVEQLTAWLGKNLQAAGAFLSSAEGAAWLTQKVQEAKAGLALLGAVTGQVWTVVSTLGGVVLDLTRWFQTLPAPVQSVVGQFLAWSLVTGVVMAKLAPLVVAIGRIGPALLKAGVWIVAHIAKLGLMAARMVVTAAVYVARWAAMAAGAMARAAVMAAAWVVAMGPIGWVTAAVVALVALVIANWDKIKSWTISTYTAVAQWIKTKIAEAKAIVLSTVASLIAWVVGGWARLRARTAAAFAGLVVAVSSALGRAVAFVAGLPGRLLGALGNAGAILYNSGVALISGFWNGLVARWNQLLAWVRGAMATLRSYWPFSPAKRGPFSGSGYVTHSGRALTADFADSLKSGLPAVESAAARVMRAAQVDVSSAVGGSGGSGLAGRIGRRVGDAVANVNIYNPVAERGSDSFAREMSDLSTMGAFST